MNTYVNIKEQDLKSYPCNLCGGKDFKPINQRDRYNFRVQTVICKKCGLIFINPRMDEKSYDDFYRETYRPLLENYKNKKTNYEKNWNNSFNLGVELGNQFGSYLNSGRTAEIGSSTGGVLAGLKTIKNDLDVLGIEPSLEESKFACAKGVKTAVGLFENLDLTTLGSFNNIAAVRSLNHLLDPKSFFIWCYKNLNQSGILLIMVIDFLKICERHLRISTQLDHLFMFSLSTLKSFLEHSGFDLVCEDIVSRPDYIKVIARKSSRAPSFDEKDFNSQIYHDSINRLNSLKLNLGFWTNKILKL